MIPKTSNKLNELYLLTNLVNSGAKKTRIIYVCKNHHAPLYEDDSTKTLRKNFIIPPEKTSYLPAKNPTTTNRTSTIQ